MDKTWIYFVLMYFTKYPYSELLLLTTQTFLDKIDQELLEFAYK